MAITAAAGLVQLRANASPAWAKPDVNGGVSHFQPAAPGPEPTPTVTPSAAPTVQHGPLLVPGPVSMQVPGFFSWAMLDRHTGAVVGSANDVNGTNTTESMIKTWITSDYLRLLGGRQPTQQRLDELSRMIRDSDDGAAEDIYRVDGGDAVVHRMISICGLTDTRAHSGWWSMTQISARDAVRLGQCVADGQAAGPTWTAWVLDQMRQVEGEGRFGIIDGLPADVAAQTSIKNGWTLIYADGLWHVNCLAVHDDFVLSVLTRYPGSLGLSYGAGVCKSVTSQLLTRH
jgi:hypothetical protein